MAQAVAVYEPRPLDQPLPRDEKGRFTAGAGYPCLFGSTSMMDAEAFASGVAAYCMSRAEQGRPITLSGCAIALGISIPTLIRWGEGSLARDEEGRRLCVRAHEYLRTARESYLEEILTNKDYATNGVKFALTNQMPERWREAPLPDGAGGPAVAVTIQVAGMAERVTVDVAPAGGRTISASALAAEASRIADAGRHATDADWAEADDDFE